MLRSLPPRRDSVNHAELSSAPSEAADGEASCWSCACCGAWCLQPCCAGDNDDGTDGVDDDGDDDKRSALADSTAPMLAGVAGIGDSASARRGGRRPVSVFCTRGRAWCLASLTVSLLVAAAAAVLYFFVLHSNAPIVPPTPPAPSAPDAPAAPAVAQTTVSSVTIAWTPPGARGFSILSYTVQCAAADDDPRAPPLVTSVDAQTLALEVDALAPATRYALSVRACNSVGCGNYSAATVAATRNATAPLAPGAPVVLASGAAFLALTWAASREQGENITGYEVQARDVSSAAAVAPLPWQTLCVTPQTACNVSDLSPATEYAFRVRGDSADGPGAWGANQSYHTDDAGARPPEPPTDVAAAGVESDALTLAWTHPAADGGAEIIAYRLEYCLETVQPPWAPNATVALTVELAAPIARTIVRIDALTASTLYRVRVRAANSAGVGASSGDLVVATSATRPPDAPTALHVVGVDAASIGVAWTAGATVPSAPLLAFELQADDWWLDAPFAPVTTCGGSGGGGQPLPLACNASGLLPASTYRFRVRERNAAGWSNFSDTLAFATNPSGNCGNAADMATFYRTKATMKAGIQGCLIGCIGSGAACAVQCVHEQVGLSVDCATCWANEGQCTVNHCLLPCLAPNSDACKACSKAQCFPACVDCSGVPEWAFPA